MSKPSNRRRLRNFLINPAYQMKYLFLLAGVGLALSLVYGWVFYAYTHENYSILVDLAPMTDEVKIQLYNELHEIILKLGIFSLAFVTSVSFLALVITHRAAGPIYHFKRVFDQVRSGNLNARIHLRPKDDFRDAADSFNQMLDEVLKDVKSDNGHQDHAA